MKLLTAALAAFIQAYTGTEDDAAMRSHIRRLRVLIELTPKELELIMYCIESEIGFLGEDLGDKTLSSTEHIAAQQDLDLLIALHTRLETHEETK